MATDHKPKKIKKHLESSNRWQGKKECEEGYNEFMDYGKDLKELRENFSE